jgi:hypothetical protein
MFMNRAARVSLLFAVLFALSAVPSFAQGQRGMIERNAWYVGADGRIAQVQYWRVFLGDFNDVTLRRTFHGAGEIDVQAGMNFQLFSSGHVEGNGASARGRVQALPRMRITVDGQGSFIRIDEIDYIFDYGTKVVLKDGRRGDFAFELNPEGTVMVPRRFQLSNFVMSTGRFGEPELTPQLNLVPIVAIAFSQEAARRAAQEPVSD